MPMPPAPRPEKPIGYEMAELLRQSLAALHLGNPFAQYLDRLETQR